MLIQRFELNGTVGGFLPDEIPGMQMRKFDEREGLEVPEPLIAQITQFGVAMTAFLKSLHQPVERAELCRMTIVGEAFPNLYIHGLRGRAELQSHIRLTVERQRTETGERLQCVLAIDDHTPAFGEVRDPTRPENREIPNGRGLLMMEHFGATVTQIGHPNSQSKTVVYTWTEDTKPLDTETESDDPSPEKVDDEGQKPD